MTDTYNADELLFDGVTGETEGVEYTHSVVGSVGTISWPNIGPIAPGTGVTRTVNFTAKALPNNVGLTTTDYASVSGVLFSNGNPAGSASDEASTDIIPVGYIGDTIYFDLNQNGVQDTIEPGISGAVVDLYLNDVFFATTTTDADGLYQFENLDAGNYDVRPNTGSGALVGATLTADPDNDGVPCADIVPPQTCDGEHAVTLAQGQTYAGADFGYFLPGGVIGGTLWIDFDNDGVVDDAEVGIPYITVTLYDSLNNIVATTETDENGEYSFGGLGDDTYRVEVDGLDSDFPAGIAQTFEIDASLNEIVSGIEVSGGVVTGTYAGQGDQINFGYRYPGDNTLSGTIGLEDPLTANGVMGSGTSGVDGDELAFSNVTVYIYLWNDDGDNVVESGEAELLGSTVTDSNGDYSFSGLPEGDGNDLYIVSMVPPLTTLFLNTTVSDTPATVLVNTTNGLGYSTGVYQAVPIAQTITDMDFAFESAVEMDFGDLPASYSGITLLTAGARHQVRVVPNLYLGAGVTTEGNGVVSADSSADANDDGVVVSGGLWSDGTGGGQFTIDVGAGSGYLVGYVDFNNDGDFLDVGEMIVSQTVSSTGGVANDGVYTIDVDVPASTLSTTGSTYLNARFRLLPTAPFIPELAFSGEASNGEVEDYQFSFNTISGTVYEDTDTTTSFSGGDTVRPGVVVELYEGATLLATTVTDLNGFYSFSGVPNGTYEVRMTTPTGATAILDADGNPAYNSIPVTVADASVTDRDYLLGGTPSLADLSGTVFRDSIDDNVFSTSPDDATLSGVQISLYRDLDSDGVADAGELIGSTVTDGNGDYLFADLPDGPYLLVMTPPTGGTPLLDVDGIAPAPNSATRIAQTLSATDVGGLDFLLEDDTPLYSISGTFYRDDDSDNVFSGGDTAVDGVTITLYLDINNDGIADPSELVTTAVTSGGGGYTFSNLPAGNYLVVSTPPTGTAPVTDIDGNANGANLIQVALASNTSGQDFLADYDGSISGTVTIDNTGDDVGDVPHVGVTVTLLDSSDNVIATTTTDGSGNYSFTELPPGTYKVTQTVPAGFTAVDDVDGGDLEIIGDITLITLPASGTVTGQDFVNSQFGAVTAPNFCVDLATTLDGIFIRPIGLPGNVVYKLQYADVLGNPTTWDGAITLNGGNTSAVDNLDGTETVTIDDLPTLTGLGASAGFVRLLIELDADNDTNVDETVTTSVSGWVQTTFGVACSTYNNPFLSCPPYSGTVQSVAAPAMVFADTLPPIGSGFYVEVTDGANEGQRFDIASADANSITVAVDAELISLTAPFNTLTGALPDISGATIVVRKHRTLEELLPVDQMTANTDQALADQVLLWDGTQFLSYYLYAASPNRWVAVGDNSLTDAGGTIVPPGHGMFVNSRAGKSVTAYGQVRENDFVRPLGVGPNLVGGAYPVDQSAVSRGMTKAAGFFGDPDFKLADQYWIWGGDSNAALTAYFTYYLLDHSPSTLLRWVRVGDTLVSQRDSEILFLRDRSVILDSRSGLPTYTMPTPWSP